MPLTLALFAMGTRFELVVDDGLEADGAALAEKSSQTHALAESALAVVSELDARLSRFRRDGIPAALARAQGAALRLTREEIVLFELCRRGHAATGGAFDPALGGVEGFAAVAIDRRARRVTAPAELAALDFGGVAKGYALDRAARVLRAGGVRTALLHGGTSSVVAIGSPPKLPAWRIALRDPVGSLRPLAQVALRDAALSVSAPHGRVREVDGRSVGHILDPRDGTAVERARLAAVVARHGATAEIASTALLVQLERALRESRPPSSCASLLPPGAGALVAFERCGELTIETLGPRADAFTCVAAPRALAESTP